MPWLVIQGLSDLRLVMKAVQLHVHLSGILLGTGGSCTIRGMHSIDQAGHFAHTTFYQYAPITSILSNTLSALSASSSKIFKRLLTKDKSKVNLDKEKKYFALMFNLVNKGLGKNIFLLKRLCDVSTSSAEVSKTRNT
jgi:hypothetical protein